MNLIILFENDFINNTNRVRIQDSRIKHIVKVHKPLVGDKLRVGLLGENMGMGRVILIKDNLVEMDVELYQSPPVPLPAVLILAMPRPRILKRILSQVSAMGIKKIILINSYRVEKSYWQTPVLLKENLRKYLIMGLEQGRDTIMPEVLVRPLFKPFVEDELSDMIKGHVTFVAHPIASEKCPYNINKPMVLAVGPEGGFITYEIEKFVEHGFKAVNLGERILHVESAIPSLISRLL